MQNTTSQFFNFWILKYGQIRHTAANISPPLQSFVERYHVTRRRNDTVIGPAYLLHASA